MPPPKTKELRSFRLDASLLTALDAAAGKRGDKAAIMEEALRRELIRRGHLTRSGKPRNDTRDEDDPDA